MVTAGLVTRLKIWLKMNTRFFFNSKNFYKKMSLKNPKTLRKY